MHLETAGEGPTNQVLQIHKSIASAKSIAIYVFYFAVILLLDRLIDVVLFVCTYSCIYSEYIELLKRRVSARKFVFWVVSLDIMKMHKVMLPDWVQSVPAV